LHSAEFKIWHHDAADSRTRSLVSSVGVLTHLGD